MSAYILFFAGLLLAGGRLADVFGRRRLFLLGLLIFTFASMVAGVAGLADMLVLARALQGIGAALLTPATLAIVTTTFPSRPNRLAPSGYGGRWGRWLWPSVRSSAACSRNTRRGTGSSS